METDEAVNSQTGGEQSGIGGAARRRGSGGSRGRLPRERRRPDTDRKDQRRTTHTETWRKQRKQTHKQSAAKQKERDTKTGRERERALIRSCTLIVTSHRATMVVQGMTHLKGEKRGRCVTICTKLHGG